MMLTMMKSHTQNTTSNFCLFVFVTANTTRSSAIADKPASLTNRAMLVCKVVEVWQDFLSEYVDKKSESIMAAKIV